MKPLRVSPLIQFTPRIVQRNAAASQRKVWVSAPAEMPALEGGLIIATSEADAATEEHASAVASSEIR